MTYVPKHRGDPVTKYRVTYIERERGWGQDQWDTDFDTETLAHEAVARCNARHVPPVAPDYYITAHYVGPVTL